MITGRRVAVVLMGMSFVANGAAGQWSAGQVALSAGSATDQRGVRSDAITLAPTFVFNLGSPATLVLGASSTRFQNGAWQLGGGTSLSARAPVAAGAQLSLF